MSNEGARGALCIMLNQETEKKIMPLLKNRGTGSCCYGVPGCVLVVALFHP